MRKPRLRAQVIVIAFILMMNILPVFSVTFTDNFENGLQSVWKPFTSSRWEITEENGNHVLFLNTSNYSTINERLGEIILLNSLSLDEFVFECDLASRDYNATADLALVFGYTDDLNYYYVCLNKAAGATELGRYENGAPIHLDYCNAPILDNQNYHHVKISRNSNELVVFFDSNEILRVDNMHSFPSGKFGLGSKNDMGCFDNVRIANNTNFNDELYFENFQSGIAYGWQPNTPSRWRISQQSGKYLYELWESNYYGHSQQLNEWSIFTLSEFTDFEYSVFIKTNEDISSNNLADYAAIFRYQNNDNYYMAFINSSVGETMLIKLVNGMETVLDKNMTPIILDQNFHELKVRAEGNSIIVYYDSISILSTNDNALSDGKIGLGSRNDAFAVDYVSVNNLGGTSNNIQLIYNQIDASNFPTITSYVTVQDDQGSSIADLTSSNFAVTENSYTCSPIQVSPVSTGGGNASFALVIDRSGSMAGSAIADAKQAAISFVNQLGTTDRATIISYSHDVVMNQSLTNNKSLLNNAINSISTTGSTSHYDAIIYAADALSPVSGQKAIISLTDGLDNNSQNDLNDCIQAVKLKNIPIFTIGLNSGSLNFSDLQQLANNTGGQYYETFSSSDLADIYQRISSSIQNQYRITYTSPIPQTNCSTRQVEITATYAGASDSDSRSYQAPCSQEADVDFDCPATCYAGSDFWLDIQMGTAGNPVSDLFGASFILNYQDTQWLDVVSPSSSNVTAGSLWGTAPVFFSDVDDPDGKVSMGISRKSGSGGVDGYGIIARVHFVISANVPNGTTLTFNLSDLNVIDSNGTTIPVNVSGCQITVQSGSYVWPGDTNNSGYVDQADVLPIGMYFQSTGPARSGASNSWSAQLCSPWSNTSAMYADCNGSGKVDQADIMAIGLNWHKSHTTVLAKANKVDGGDAVQCRVEALDEEVGLYQAIISVNDLQGMMGLAFCLSAESGQEYITLQNVSYDGVFGDDIIHFDSIEPETQSVYVGMSRKAGNGSFSGSGDVCFVHFKSTAPEFASMSFRLTEVVGTSATGENVNFDEQQFDYTVDVQTENHLPNRLVLYPNHPNPFNPLTTICFEIPEATDVRLEIVNINGKTVRTLVNEHKPAGSYSAQWDATDDAGRSVASGVYLYRLVAGNEVVMKKLLFAK